MKINVITCLKCNESLISYHRHDYKTCKCKNSFVDGGFDYTRYNAENSTLEEKEIKDASSLNRNQFKWGKNYDKDNNPLPKTEWVLLKDLDTSHIVNILIYFTNQIKIDGINVKSSLDKQWVAYHLFFLEELKYRLGQQSAGDIESTRESN